MKGLRVGSPVGDDRRSSAGLSNVRGEALAVFEMGMHQAFLVSFAITMVAAVISYLRPSNHVQINRETLA